MCKSSIKVIGFVAGELSLRTGFDGVDLLICVRGDEMNAYRDIIDGWVESR